MKYAYLEHIDNDDVIIDIKKLIDDIQNKEVSKPKNSPKESTTKKVVDSTKKARPKELESDDEDKDSKKSTKSKVLSPKDLERKY